MVREHFGAAGHQQGWLRYHGRNRCGRAAMKDASPTSRATDGGHAHGDGATRTPPSTGSTPTRTGRSAATSSPRAARAHRAPRRAARTGSTVRQARREGAASHAHAPHGRSDAGRPDVRHGRRQQGRPVSLQAEAEADGAVSISTRWTPTATARSRPKSAALAGQMIDQAIARRKEERQLIAIPVD